MKRLIPAAIILIFIIVLCILANISVTNNLEKTLDDINRFKNSIISEYQLQESWSNTKEKLSVFVNHGPLDDISVYIGQLTLLNSDTTYPQFEAIYKNIQTIISSIKEDLRFSVHSFY